MSTFTFSCDHYSQDLSPYKPWHPLYKELGLSITDRQTKTKMGSSAYWQVIGEVLGDMDMAQHFVPRVPMYIYYGIGKVISGCELNASDVKNVPRVYIGGESDELYTLIMIDPDAPNPNEPCLKQVVSWIVTNIHGPTSYTQGTEVVPYEVSNPEVGIHRNIFALYQQQYHIDNVEPPASRVCFNIRDFAARNNLGDPVRVTYFNMRRQSNKRKNRG
ncbi:hypothetical protein LXL04_035575 [Taraxacum kok-saghyz]